MGAAVLACVTLPGCAHDEARPELHFSIEDGAVRNEFLRDGPVAAHVVLKSGDAPRLIIAFPAGNSGVGLWFEKDAGKAEWAPVQDVRPVVRTLDDGSKRYGVSFKTVINARSLRIRRAILGNIRVLRDYKYVGRIPPSVETPATVRENEITWERRRLDGAAGYFLSVDAINGRVATSPTDGLIDIASNGEAGLELRITALSGDAPLVGIPERALLSGSAAADDRLRNVLTFLAYEEKFLAGSWQYDTYFGRDTLMSLALLGDSLQPRAIGAGLASVLERLSETGEVAHEEDIGEYALLRRIENGEPAIDAPILDYKMIDDDFLLAPILAQHLLDAPGAAGRARPFLARRRADGADFRELALRNARFVIGAARPYGEAPHWSQLIRVRQDSPPVGNWRDSDFGLGGGVYPYDVNVALVPAALRAAARLCESGLLGENEETAQLSREARRLHERWSGAATHFKVTIEAESARRHLDKVSRREGFPSTSAVFLQDRSVAFSALALDKSGAPIAVMHSDVGFDLFFGTPPTERLEEAARLVLQPYPAGLMTPAGMLVANGAHAPDDVAAEFGRDQYHGAVVWSWQQALMAAGLGRQLSRPDLAPSTRQLLSAARCALGAAIERGKHYRSAELWTWTLTNGIFARAPFGESDSHEAESNAAQLWSAVFLQTKDASPPTRGSASCQELPAK